MSISLKTTMLAICVCAWTCGGVAQTLTSGKQPDNLGWTAHVTLEGSAYSPGLVMDLDSSIGYNFSKHFGMDIGVPVYFISSPTTTTTGNGSSSTSNDGIGNAYVNLRWNYPHDLLGYHTNLAGFAPTGDPKKGLGTGHATFDWNNRIDHEFERITPFLGAGFANTIANSRFFKRPFTSYGYNAHFELGTEVDVWKFLSAGASLYDIEPMGNQTLYSRFHGNGVAAQHNRFFQSANVTTGSASIAKDNGYSAWVDANPISYLDCSFGYSRSVHYAFNSISFGVGLDLGHWLKGANGK